MATAKKTLDDIVYEKLKKAIVFQKFSPNYKLVESELAQMLKVSRTPVHTALKLLEREGLLAIIPNKGAFVTKKTFKEIIDAFQVRIELEKMSVEIAIKHISDVNISELEELLSMEERAYTNNKRFEAYTIGADFHKKIAEITGNVCLLKYIDNIMNETNTYDIFYILNDPMLEKAYLTPTQHRDILDALKKRDANLAISVMQNHISTTLSQLHLIMLEDESNLVKFLEEN